MTYDPKTPKQKRCECGRLYIAPNSSYSAGCARCHQINRQWIPNVRVDESQEARCPKCNGRMSGGRRGELCTFCAAEIHQYGQMEIIKAEVDAAFSRICGENEQWDTYRTVDAGLKQDNQEYDR